MTFRDCFFSMPLWLIQPRDYYFNPPPKRVPTLRAGVIDCDESKQRPVDFHRVNIWFPSLDSRLRRYRRVYRRLPSISKADTFNCLYCTACSKKFAPYSRSHPYVYIHSPPSSELIRFSFSFFFYTKYFIFYSFCQILNDILLKCIKKTPPWLNP